MLVAYPLSGQCVNPIRHRLLGSALGVTKEKAGLSSAEFPTSVGIASSGALFAV